MIRKFIQGKLYKVSYPEHPYNDGFIVMPLHLRNDMYEVGYSRWDIIQLCPKTKQILFLDDRVLRYNLYVEA